MSAAPVKSRFDGSGTAQAPYTTTLSSAMRTILRAYGRALRVCLPARVEAIRGDYTVDVRPGFLEVHSQATMPTAMPLLPGVPVSMPHGAKFSVRYPLTVGDTGYVLVADRSIDTWLAGDGAAADPRDARTHDLTDAIFVPGLLTTSQANAAQSGGSDLVLRAGAAALHLQQSGAFELSNGHVELVAQVQSLAQQVAQLAAFVSGAVCPPGGALSYPASPQAAATAAQTASIVAGNLAALKGS